MFQSFTQNTSNKTTNQQLLANIRQDIIGELDAINQYNQHISSTDNALARKVWQHIRDDERHHVGELTTLLFYLSPDDAKDFAEGEAEVNNMMKELGLI